MCNRSNVHKEGTGELEEKVSIVEGEDKTARRGSHVRNWTELSKEGDQAQKHAVGYHTGGHVYNHMELAVMGLDAQEAGRSVDSYEGSTGIKESGGS